MLQCGHGSDAVETHRGRESGERGVRFNAATAVTPWRLEEYRVGDRRGFGFNAATAVTLWRRSSDGHVCPRWGGFNAATAVTPWRPSGTTDAGIISDVLQCGHGSDAVETWYHQYTRQ